MGRSLPWGVLGAAAGLGPVLGWFTRLTQEGVGTALAVFLLRVAAVGLALGLAFLLDDPARDTTAVVPIRRVVRSGVRLVLVAPLAASSWAAALLLVPERIRPPAGDLTLEAAALVVLALSGAACAVRFSDTPRPGVAVAGTLLTCTLLATLLPTSGALFVQADAASWAVAHQRWAALLTLALLAGAALQSEPVRKHRLRLEDTHRSAARAAHR
ncbi:ABC transporter [Streptomyces sp. RY43-2]|uniref:ABC transporter n=1 Tax=Streptomyces macrolidinus TaxID=2952607 RepID=A0ABT0ZKU6_9ACTN|nr:ABC transporter [Streptomyces macrolidinus]MCN9244186.1 ABC transporter [Streptomyces macrolidinus]